MNFDKVLHKMLSDDAVSLNYLGGRNIQSSHVTPASRTLL